jgi:hypothetical protein
MMRYLVGVDHALPDGRGVRERRGRLTLQCRRKHFRPNIKAFDNLMAAVLFRQRNKRLHQHRGVHGPVHHGLITQGGLAQMHYLDVVSCHEAF